MAISYLSVAAFASLSAGAQLSLNTSNHLLVISMVYDPPNVSRLHVHNGAINGAGGILLQHNVQDT